MKFRRNPLPRRLVDVLCFLTIVVVIPLGILYDFIFVLPAYHQPGGYAYAFTVLTVLFMFLNGIANLIACMIVDTSVDQRVVLYSNGDVEPLNWRHCAICDKLAPPRSWHCKACGVCILKRDHHCMFTGCCIGHLNYRYFVCFVFYLFVLSAHLLVYNSIHLKSFFSLLTIFHFWTDPWGMLHKHLLSLNVLLFVITSITLVYNVPKMLRGRVCTECKASQKYNCGVNYNLKNIFGQQMYIAWLSPLIKSQLPDDGYTWKSKSVDDKLK
ncbi:uncharacterized protein Dvir_GJ21996, isoform C [Drosophila virilis]|uniref:Palmitoyltransferase n=1 Tax=Drosophila virilis TaxID=7244 RepID=A0A0Q9WGW5_DROVI|nr:probable palmitoyltransferase ZDHHC24 isoform X2 [Drosophila virilis]KRF79957.1 uncharacterized protein Dvir_GJ21996, isoform C [Drosophila virilis]